MQHGSRVLPEILQHVCNRLFALDTATFAEFGAINGAAIILAPTFGKTDQRGTGFARISGSHTDIGAFEHQELGGTERLFTPESLEYIKKITGDIERLTPVERVQSLATANTVTSLPATADDDGGIEVQPLIDERLDGPQGHAVRVLRVGALRDATDLRSYAGLRLARRVGMAPGGIEPPHADSKSAALSAELRGPRPEYRASRGGARAGP